MDPTTATPNAEPIQPAGDQDRTAGQSTPQDAPVGLTQAQIDAIVQSRLAEQQRRLQAKYGNLDDLKAKADQHDQRQQAELTELERLQQRLNEAEAKQAELQQQAETERLKALRLRVGQEVGLPPILAERLTGTDEDTLKADAEALKAVLGENAPAARIPDLNATAGGGQQGAGKRHFKLTPGQMAAADKAGIPYDQYAQILHEMPGGSNE